MVDETPIDLRRYSLLFFGFFLLLSVLLMVIAHFLPEDMSMTGMSTAMPMLAALLTGERIVKSYNRLPTKSEIWKLTIMGFLIVVILNGLLFVALLQSPAGSELFDRSVLTDPTFVKIIAWVLPMILILQFFMIKFGYGKLLQLSSRKHLEK